ncbi:MAG TPA: hypothetical protein VL123_03595 [Candidatus Udaeobacter sp.]|jgi:hypothetical protein|nr:hypothetical protein [Candidatus Udaeobacter sp.]
MRRHHPRAPRRAPRHAAGLRIAVALGALAVAGCAHAPHVAELAGGTMRELYETALARRASAASAIEADGSLWVRRSAGKRYPGVLAELRIGTPDRFRLRINDPFGAGFMMGGSGDRVAATLLSRGLYFEGDHVGDTLGIAHPSELVVRAVAALWHPPAAAWEEARRRGSPDTLSWQDGGERVILALDSGAQPRSVEWTVEEGRPLHIAYLDWSDRAGSEWPGQITISDPVAGARVVFRVERWRDRSSSDSAIFAVPHAADAQRIEWSDLRRALRKIETP